MTVNRRRHEDVRTQIWPQCLPILNELAQEEAAVESVGDIPRQLGEDAQKCRYQIGDAQMQDKEVHSR